MGTDLDVEWQLTSRLLDRRSIDKAYPLIRGILPNVSRARWAKFARSHLTARPAQWPKSLMTIQNKSGYILGLFGFEVRTELRNDRVLLVDNVVVPQIPGHDLVWTAMMEVADTLAQMNSCLAIHVNLSDDLTAFGAGQNWLRGSLLSAGYVVEGINGFKTVETRSSTLGQS